MGKKELLKAMGAAHTAKELAQSLIPEMQRKQREYQEAIRADSATLREILEKNQNESTGDGSIDAEAWLEIKLHYELLTGKRY